MSNNNLRVDGVHLEEAGSHVYPGQEVNIRHSFKPGIARQRTADETNIVASLMSSKGRSGEAYLVLLCCK